MLLLGEVRTCLLRASRPLPTAVAAQALALIPGQRVRTTNRPLARSVSPPLLTGVDCRLATAQNARTRGVGTVSTTANITAGLVLQASAQTRVERAAGPSRLGWAHYAAQPGVIEILHATPMEAIASGFLATPSPGPTLDLGSVSERLIGTIQRDERLDHVTAVRSRTTRVRWVAVPSDTAEAPRARVRLDDGVVRTIELTMPADELDSAASFCEDFALHDWLLTTLAQVIEQAERLRAAGHDPIDVVRTAVERLVHLWMPGARLEASFAPVWRGLERNPGFSRQWRSQVDRIRDQIALQTLQALVDARPRAADW
jgi:hypothetical protein